MHPRFARAACLLLAGLAGAGCAKRFDVPVPALAAPTPLPPSEPATITLPISLALSSLRTQIESQFPAVDSLDQAKCSALGGMVCHQYVYRRDTLDLHMEGDRIDLMTRVRYRGRVALPRVGGLGSCGYAPEEMRHAELHFSTALYWRKDWSLGSRASALEAKLPDRCEVTVLKVNATPLMQRIANSQLEALRRQVDSAFPTLANMRPVADSLWQAFQEPTALDSAGSVWLLLDPETVSMAPLVGVGEMVTTAVVLSARPRVVLGAKPSPAPRPLPVLTLVPPPPAGEFGSLHVPVQIELPFADLSQQIATLLAGEAAGQGFTVKDAKVWGVGDTAAVRVDLAGKVSGSLYLLGRVAYDSATRAVTISDLRYTVASADAMTRVKATLGAPLIRRALDEATGRGRLDVGAQLDSIRDRLTTELNRPLAPGMAMAGAVRSVRIAGLHTTQTAFVLRVVLDGEARLDVQ